MYKQNFKLEPDDYLDVVADEAIFRKLIKQNTYQKVQFHHDQTDPSYLQKNI